MGKREREFPYPYGLYLQRRALTDTIVFCEAGKRTLRFYKILVLSREGKEKRALLVRAETFFSGYVFNYNLVCLQDYYHSYLPPSYETARFGDYEVTVDSLETLGDIVVRKLRMAAIKVGVNMSQNASKKS